VIAGPHPGGRKFIFTILDDTDDATVENVEPVYSLLYELGFRTTKTVWPLACPEGSSLYFAGDTLANPQYLAFVHSLVDRGFELASHCATMESSNRERTERGLQFFKGEFGIEPKVHCNHGQNLENIYWGADRYRTTLIRTVLTIAERLASRPRYYGHVEESPYFWGDLCRDTFRFVRNFAFRTLDSGAISPHAPYKLASTPYVNYWFNTADAPDASAFKRLVTPAAIDGLRDKEGICILSTHLGKGFARNGKVDAKVEDVFRYIAAQPGWFVPVSEVLEYMLSRTANHVLTATGRWKLEGRHVVDRLLARLSPTPGFR
jgi:hypothetical protein